MLTDKQKADCLAVNPFEGDFGDGERLLSDRIVTARCDNTCCDCGGVAKSGTNHRVMTEVYDGKVRTARWCEECCAAMALSWEDDGAAWEGRINLHRDRPANEGKNP